MPDAARTVAAFVRRFNPERTRVLFISPDRSGDALQDAHMTLVATLRPIAGVEFAWIDAQYRRQNGLLITDFFDFT
jgi:hypothetical protein